MSNVKPTQDEEEYFARQEIEKRRILVEKLKAQMANEELEKLKKLHYMHCTKCGFEMHSVVFKGVTIEKCPNCNGIYLDDGELDQLAGKEGGFFKNVLGLFK